MKRVFFLLLTVTLFSGYSLAQSQSSVIKTQAMAMARALIKKDFATFSGYVHPAIIEMAGGHSKMISQMDTINAIAKQFGAEIRKILIGNPGPVLKYNKELQVTLPQTTAMKTGFGQLMVETTLIAISKNGGRNWYFIDTSVYKAEDIKKALPNLSPQLVIPPAKQPKFTPDK